MSFQVPAATTTAASTGFSFGLTSTPATGAAKPTFSFGSTGGGDAGVTKPLGLALGTTPATSTPGTVGFGTQRAPTLGGFGSGIAAPAAAVPAPTTTTQPMLSFGAVAVVSTAPPAVVAPSTSTGTFTVPKPAAGATSLGLAAPTPAASSIAGPTTSTTGFASLTTATKTTDSTNVATSISYNQLEEHINKWTLELEEQEKVFTEQATQINAWDKILISNNQKILELNDAVQKVKSDQQTLEQELEFIATQHHELEESIVPLQKEFMKIPQVDMERSQTYLMVENLDTQLKQMSEDLKEIIDNLNEANKGQDNTDPIIQIGKILNAHMSSLQWIESSSTNIGNKLEDITKMHETFKRDSEHSFRSAYYN